MRSNQQSSNEIESRKTVNVIKRFVPSRKTLIWCFVFLIIGGGRIQCGNFNCEIGGIPVLLREFNNFLNDQNKRELLKHAVEKSKELNSNTLNNITFLKPPPH